MANLIRSQNIARQQRQQIGQQQPQQQQQQFNFDPSQSGSPGQPQPFHDSQPNQPPVPPMPNNFAQMSPAELQAMFNNRGAMLQAFQANQGHSRQIELMNLAQNQQPQNGNFARMAQQQGMNGQQGFNPAQPTDMFSSPAMAPTHDGMHNSPSHAPLQPPGQMGNQHMNVPQNGGGMPAQARRPYNINDMQARMTALRDVVRRLEQEGAQVQLQRAALGDAYMPKMQQIVQELKVKKEMLHKMAIAMNQFMANAGNAGNMYGNSSLSRTFYLHTASGTRWGFPLKLSRVRKAYKVHRDGLRSRVLRNNLGIPRSDRIPRFQTMDSSRLKTCSPARRLCTHRQGPCRSKT